MMTALLLYGYCSGVYSSRRIAKAARERVDFMSIVGLDPSDFRTVSDFRKRHLQALAGLFGQVLKLCGQAGLAKLGHVALDGAKIKANASKHKAMSYERMARRAAELEAEVARWLSAAEAADAEEDKAFGRDRSGEELPDWVADKQKRAEKIRAAKAELEAEAKALAEAKAKAKGEGRGTAQGRGPQETGKARRPARGGARSQSAEEFHRSRKPHHEDQGRLHPGLQRAGGGGRHRPGDCRPPARRQSERSASLGADGRGDRGQFGQEAGANVGGRRLLLRRQPCGDGATRDRRLYRAGAAQARRGRRSGGARLAAMREKIRAGGHESPYRLRKQLPEPVFGQIKQARGFRQFLLRGLDKAAAEWGLVCLAHNVLKLAKGRSPSPTALATG